MQPVTSINIHLRFFPPHVANPVWEGLTQGGSNHAFVVALICATKQICKVRQHGQIVTQLRPHPPERSLSHATLSSYRNHDGTHSTNAAVIAWVSPKSCNL